jgi:hypothetical protein
MKVGIRHTESVHSRLIHASITHTLFVVCLMSYRKLDVDVYEEGTFVGEEEETESKGEYIQSLQDQLQEKLRELRAKLTR